MKHHQSPADRVFAGAHCNFANEAARSGITKYKQNRASKINVFLLF
jgi:hypothetical protein